MEVYGCHGRSLWKKIGEGKEKFLNCIRWKVGKGDRLNFWKDNWMEGGSLMSQFPQIYSIALNREARISDYHYGEIGAEGEWQVEMTRTLMTGKLVSLESCCVYYLTSHLRMKVIGQDGHLEKMACLL